MISLISRFRSSKMDQGMIEWEQSAKGGARQSRTML